MAQIHPGQLQHLQQSLASVHAALEVKSEALSRAEAGRVRLRAALVEQRTTQRHVKPPSLVPEAREKKSTSSRGSP